MKHSPSLRFIFPTAMLVLGSLAALGSAPRVAVARSSTAPASDAATAWAELRAAAQQKLYPSETAEDPEKLAREVLVELEQFATTYAGTPEATFAMFNHGSLALKLGDDAVAEHSFREARRLTNDPQFAAHIDSQLAQFTIRPGKEPPDFAATTLAGKNISPDDFRGRVVLLDFWATWCGPCIAELPNVQEVYRENHDGGFDIVSFSLDRNQAALTDFLETRKMPWMHVFDTAAAPDASVAARYGVNAIPFMVLIGRDGKIAGVNLRGPALAKAVKEALAESTAPEKRTDDS